MRPYQARKRWLRQTVHVAYIVNREEQKTGSKLAGGFALLGAAITGSIKVVKDLAILVAVPITVAIIGAASAYITTEINRGIKEREQFLKEEQARDSRINGIVQIVRQSVGSTGGDGSIGMFTDDNPNVDVAFAALASFQTDSIPMLIAFIRRGQNTDENLRNLAASALVDISEIYGHRQKVIQAARRVLFGSRTTQHPILAHTAALRILSEIGPRKTVAGTDMDWFHEYRPEEKVDDWDGQNDEDKEVLFQGFVSVFVAIGPTDSIPVLLTYLIKLESDDDAGLREAAVAELIGISTDYGHRQEVIDATKNVLIGNETPRYPVTIHEAALTILKGIGPTKDPAHNDLDWIDEYNPTESIAGWNQSTGGPQGEFEVILDEVRRMVRPTDGSVQ